MFYNLSDVQINIIKEKFYPQELYTGEFLKNVIVNSYGSDNADNIIRVIYSFKDGVKKDNNEEPIFKVFNNQQAKKYLKLKLFEISTSKMRDEVEKITDIQKLNNIIIKYGSQSRDLSPSYDLIGNPSVLSEHVKNEDDSINLNYDVTFILPRATIGFLSIGAIFYFDKQSYLNDQKVDERFIDKRILLDKIYIYDLYRNNQIISNTLPVSFAGRNTTLPPVPPNIQDLRLIKSIFKENASFNSLLNVINSEFSYNIVSNTRRLMQQDNLSFSSDITNEQQTYTQISNLNKNITKTKYFSNAYYSRNFNNSLGLIFNINYYDIIKDNSAYLKILNKTNIKQDFINYCKISSIKILRRSLQEKGKNKYLPKQDTQIVLIYSGEAKEFNTINDQDDDLGTIKELNIDTNLQNVGTSLRSFSVTDKKIYSLSRGIYQYGVEIEIADGINQLLNETADDLTLELPDLYNYLEEANKIVKIDSNDINNIQIKGNYDPLKNEFTSQFIDSFDKPRGNNPSYKQTLERTAAKFVEKIYLLGLNRKDPNFSRSVTDVIVNMLDPKSTNAQTIQYFISTYERFIQQIKNIVKDNFNNTFSIKKWFTNDYINTEIPINIGYKFMDMDYTQGFGTILNDSFTNRLELEANKYSINSLGDSPEFFKKKYSFITPEIVYSSGKALDLQTLIENSASISNLDYVELEMDIKNKNYFGFYQKYDENRGNINTNDLEKVKNNELSLKINNLMNSFSIKYENLIQNFPDQRLEIEKQNEFLNTSLLSLAISRQIDVNNKKNFNKIIKSNIKSINKNNVGQFKDILKKTTKFNPKNEFAFLEETNKSEDLPIHLDLLLENNCKLLNSKDEYLKKLDLISKFNFLFNTIHSIEILEINSTNYEEKWSLLTPEIVDKLKKDSFYICRMKSYKNKVYNIDGLEDIKLPIYNEHFLLFNNNLNNEIVVSQFERAVDVKNNALQRIKEKTALSSNINNIVKTVLKETTIQPQTNLQPTSNQTITILGIS